MWFTTLLLSAAPVALPTPTTIPSPGAPAFAGVDAVDDAIAAAGKDADKLVELGDQWSEDGEYDAARKAYEAALKVDDDHAGAREGLGHHSYDGKWYATYAALAKAMRDDARRRLEEDGVVRVGDDWVPVDDAPFHRMGWEKVADGHWGPPGTLARLEDDKKKESEGYQRQHRTWIHPNEFDQWRSGLFKVGDEWLTAEKANEAHAVLGAWWEVPGEHYVALTTVPEEDSRWVVWWADQTHADLQRMFGLTPRTKPEFVVLNGLTQYNSFAAGSQSPPMPPADVNGHSSLHYAFFTDGWVENAADGTPVFRGTGAAYYDTSDAALKPFGQHAIRHAAALAWLEAVDPSWNAVSKMVTSPTGGFPDLSFWNEKRIPRWLRYGAAAYCERFFEDENTGEGGDPLWARKWAMDNLKKDGPLDPVETILELEFDTNDPAGSTRRIHEAGLLVHYILDGDDKRVDKAWKAYREALVAGDDVDEAISDLEAELVKAEKKIGALL